jgi:hypothetical protein
MQRSDGQRAIKNGYELAPETKNNLVKRGKCKVLAESGPGPVLSPLSPCHAIQMGEALHLFAGLSKRIQKKNTSEHVGSAAPLVAIERTPDISGIHEDHEAFRILHVACAQGYAVDIIYRSARDPAIPMRISPHTLVCTNGRQHFRCWIDETSSSANVARPLAHGMHGKYYGDIVPYRVVACRLLGRDEYVGPAADNEWHRIIDLVLQIDPSLPEQVRDLAALEMQGAPGFRFPYLVIPNVRFAMASYVERDIAWRHIGGSDPVKILNRLSADEAKVVLDRG